MQHISEIMLAQDWLVPWSSSSILFVPCYLSFFDLFASNLIDFYYSFSNNKSLIMLCNSQLPITSYFVPSERNMPLPDPLEHMQLGWWSGISGNLSDPYGLIIRISAEHGRYVARSYDTRY
jgi:hypothetical protein